MSEGVLGRMFTCLFYLLPLQLPLASSFIGCRCWQHLGAHLS